MRFRYLFREDWRQSVGNRGPVALIIVDDDLGDCAMTLNQQRESKENERVTVGGYAGMRASTLVDISLLSKSKFSQGRTMPAINGLPLTHSVLAGVELERW